MCDCHACHIPVHRVHAEINSTRPVKEMSYEELLNEYQVLAYAESISPSQNRRMIAVQDEMETRPEYKIREEV